MKLVKGHWDWAGLVKSVCRSEWDWLRCPAGADVINGQEQIRVCVVVGEIDQESLWEWMGLVKRVGGNGKNWSHACRNG